MQNRGVGFTAAEREALGLTGRLPAAVLTLRERFQRRCSHPHSYV
jgi:malate dehydrogenase (oxaloacetate-decarboxylating)